MKMFREFILIAVTGSLMAAGIEFLWHDVEQAIWNEAHLIRAPHPAPSPCREMDWQSGFIEVHCPAGIIVGGTAIVFPVTYKTENMNYDEVIEEVQR